jgi:hypothetical protein
MRNAECGFDPQSAIRNPQLFVGVLFQTEALLHAIWRADTEHNAKDDNQIV